MSYTKVNLKDSATGFKKPSDALSANKKVFENKGQVQRIGEEWFCWQQIAKQKIWVREA